MQQNIYETFQAILFLEMPKNEAGNIIIFDREIKGWSIGDRKLKPALPAIAIYGQSFNKKEVASLTYEIEHVINIKLEVAQDDQTITAAILQEFERLIHETIASHRQIWVLTQCPFCMKKALSPEHFLIEHNNVFGPYVTTAVNNAETIWNETHTSSMPALSDARKAVMAFDLIYQRIKNNQSVSYMTAEQKRNMNFVISTKMKPIRLLYNVKISDIKPTDNGIDKQTFHIGEITIHAMEISKIPASGPNNVSTEAWSIR